MRGLIDRRILANYRVDPEVLARHLPAPFQPQLVAGYAIAGICLIRLTSLRPRWTPGWIGLRSENAAHRMAVEWEEAGERRHGVYIPRRDTSSWLNTLAGGRLFPGLHHHANFRVLEENGDYRVQLDSDDDRTHVSVKGRLTSTWPAESVFRSLDEASAFFQRGALGYSATLHTGEFDGLELRTRQWHAEPLAVESIASSFFEDPTRFPPGSIEFDCALLMRGIDHEWHGQGTLCCSPDPAGQESSTRSP